MPSARQLIAEIGDPHEECSRVDAGELDHRRADDVLRNGERAAPIDQGSVAFRGCVHLERPADGGGVDSEPSHAVGAASGEHHDESDAVLQAAEIAGAVTRRAPAGGRITVVDEYEPFRVFDAVVAGGVEVGDRLHRDPIPMDHRRRRRRRRRNCGRELDGNGGARRRHRGGCRYGGGGLRERRWCGLGFRRLVDNDGNADECRCSCDEDADGQQPLTLGLPHRPAVIGPRMFRREIVDDGSQSEQHRKHVRPGIGGVDRPLQHRDQRIGNQPVQLPAAVGPRQWFGSHDESMNEHRQRDQIGTPGGRNGDGVIGGRTVENDPADFSAPSDVVRFDPAMGEPCAVQGRQGLGHGDRDPDRFG